MGNLRSSYRSPGWGGAGATRPVHPECPDASSGCIEGARTAQCLGRGRRRTTRSPRVPRRFVGVYRGARTANCLGRGRRHTTRSPRVPRRFVGVYRGARTAQCLGRGRRHTTRSPRVPRRFVGVYRGARSAPCLGRGPHQYWRQSCAPLKSEHLLGCSYSTPVLFCARGIALSPHPHPLSAVPPRNAACRFAPRCADSDRADPEQSVPSTGQVCHPPDTNGTERHTMAQFSPKKTAGSLSALSRPPASSRLNGCEAGAGRTQSQRRRWKTTRSATDTAPLSTMTAANDQPLSSTGRSMFMP